jgi:hypothetical protein
MYLKLMGLGGQVSLGMVPHYAHLAGDYLLDAAKLINGTERQINGLKVSDKSFN